MLFHKALEGLLDTYSSLITVLCLFFNILKKQAPIKYDLNNTYFFFLQPPISACCGENIISKQHSIYKNCFKSPLPDKVTYYLSHFRSKNT